MRIAIMGAGALGIVVGAFMAEKGLDVDLIVARPENARALCERGAVIIGSIEKTVPVRAMTPENVSGRYDHVFLLAKRTANPDILPRLPGHLHPASTVCTLQNGVPEEEVAEAVGASRTVGGVVLFGATREAPGVTRITSSRELLEKYAFQVGETDGRLTPRIEEVRALLAQVGGCQAIDNLMSLRWAKLLVNCTFGAITSMLGSPAGDILENRQAMEFVARVADETIRVAHACGHRLAPLQGKDMERFQFEPGQNLDDKMPFYLEFFSPWAKTTGSPLQDLIQGRKTEIGHLNGYVCRKAAERGLPAPANAIVLKLITEAEARPGRPDFAANLARATALLRESAAS